MRHVEGVARSRQQSYPALRISPSGPPNGLVLLAAERTLLWDAMDEKYAMLQHDEEQHVPLLDRADGGHKPRQTTTMDGRAESSQSTKRTLGVPRVGSSLSFLATVVLTALCTYSATKAWETISPWTRPASCGAERRLAATPVALAPKDDSPFGWQPCFPPNGTISTADAAEPPRFYCGSLVVPLDYTNASDPRTVTLAMTKYVADPHAKTKSERTLVVNPGGPGGSGGSIVYRKGQQFNELFTNGKYDVVAWDPRGESSGCRRIELGADSV